MQDKAWFDEKTVDNISFLDAFSVHQMESVVSRIQTLGVEVVPILGSCTCVIQPVDGFNNNKPFIKPAYCAPSLQLVDSADDDARNN